MFPTLAVPVLQVAPCCRSGPFKSKDIVSQHCAGCPLTVWIIFRLSPLSPLSTPKAAERLTAR